MIVSELTGQVLLMEFRHLKYFLLQVLEVVDNNLLQEVQVEEQLVNLVQIYKNLQVTAHKTQRLVALEVVVVKLQVVKVEEVLLIKMAVFYLVQVVIYHYQKLPMIQVLNIQVVVDQDIMVVVQLEDHLVNTLQVVADHHILVIHK